jgi:amino acid transporter
MASAAIGFAEYLNYFVPLGDVTSKIVSGTVVILVIVLLYRKIEAIGKLSVIMWLAVIVIFAWIIGGGISHGKILEPLKHLNDNVVFNQLFFIALGQASVKTIYSFLGYYNVCHLGGEIVNPGKNIPRSMLISVVGITILYVAMNLSVTSVIPWNEAMNPSDAVHNKLIVSKFISIVSGEHAAGVATAIILVVAFASLFSATLGYSRVPYAAAADGSFFKIFARLHPTKNFPYVSLLFLGALGFIFSLLFKMKYAIDAILAMRIIVQFIAQAVGVVLLRKRNGSAHLPFKMWLYPLPVIFSIVIWLFVLYATGWFALIGILLTGVGVIVDYLTRKIISRQGPS